MKYVFTKSMCEWFKNLKNKVKCSVFNKLSTKAMSTERFISSNGAVDWISYPSLPVPGTSSELVAMGHKSPGTGLAGTVIGLLIYCIYESDSGLSKKTNKQNLYKTVSFSIVMLAYYYANS